MSEDAFGFLEMPGFNQLYVLPRQRKNPEPPAESPTTAVRTSVVTPEPEEDPEPTTTSSQTAKT